MQNIGKEFTLAIIIIPWVVWITISMFASQKADAVQETKYDYIVVSLKDIKEGLDKLGTKGWSK